MSCFLPACFFLLFLLNCKDESQPTLTRAITGAGSSFPYPVVAQWAYRYNKVFDIKVNYQSIGSAGGIAQVSAGTTDFGITGAPLSIEQLKASNLVQLPLVIGGVVPVVNLPGIAPGELKLTGALLARIYLGDIRNWNSVEIEKINPEIDLPDQEIFLIRRADGSGTTWIFTNYLSQVSEVWNERVGFSKLANWPEISTIAGKGNEGVASYVQKIEGALGYVEYSYALKNHMTFVALQNRRGNFTQPGYESFFDAANHATWAAGSSYPQLTHTTGEKAWPITGTSFYIFADDIAKEQALTDFYNWCIKSGKRESLELQYVPVPASMVRMANNMMKM